MPDLRSTERKIKIAMAALGLIALAAVAVLFSPLVGSQRARHQELDMLWKELQQKTRQVEPLRGMDKKIVVARQQIDQFYKDRLPAQDSAISEALGRVAARSGVSIGHIKYMVKDPVSVGLSPVVVEADFSGNYLQLVRFINSLERDQLFFIVTSVQLGGEQAGVVRLQMKLQTFLKTGAESRG
jgi:type IV pilus assembly protein PilO